MKSFPRIYLAIQGIVVLLWWTWLLLIPSAQAYFHAPTLTPVYLFAFLPGDVLIVAGGSLLTAFLWREGPPPPLIWLVAGALAYTTAFLVVLWMGNEIPAAGPVLMIVASLATGICIAASRT